MMEEILSNLRTEHAEEFHVVRLNGFIHTDDKLALKEIWRQLGREMEIEDDLVNKVRLRGSCSIVALITILIQTDQQLCRHHGFSFGSFIPPRGDHGGR